MQSATADLLVTLCQQQCVSLACRFRPISAAEVTSQPSVKSSVVSEIGVSVHDVTRSTCDSTADRRNSRTVLMPSPSSAFSVPSARHGDTVPPTTCRNTDVDVPNAQTAQHHDTPDIECRYRRRGTVKEMAQSYDRATRNEVSARRLSYTFRPTLPTTTTTTDTTTTTTSVSNSVARPSQAVTAEARSDHYTTTSVFSLSKAGAQPEKLEATRKPRETKLKRLYANTVASLYKSLDNLARFQGPLAADRNQRNAAVQESATESSEADLRRSASSHHIMDVGRHAATDRNSRFRNNNGSNIMATFPLSSRHHSHSIHTLTNLSAQNFRDVVVPEMEKSRDDVSGSGAQSTASKNDRKHNHSSWNVVSEATKRLDSGKIFPNISSTKVAETDAKKRQNLEAGVETKTAEIKVMLDRNFAAEPAKTSRSLTVRKSPSISAPSSTNSTSSSLSMAFVSPRPIRKAMHHLEPHASAASPRARPTSVAALEKFEDAQRLLMKTADLPSTASDGQNLKSSSPCKTLIELVRESHMSVFPPSLRIPSSSSQFSSGSWMTSPDLENTEVTSAGASHGRNTQSGTRNDRSEEKRNRSASAANSGLASNDNNQAIRSISPVPQLRVTPPARTASSMPSPFNASAPRFSPTAQPQRARLGVISPHVSGPSATSLQTTTGTTYTSQLTAYHYPQIQHSNEHHQKLPQNSSHILTQTHRDHEDGSLQNLSKLPSFAAVAAASAAALKPFEFSTARSSSALHSCATSLADQPTSQLGQVKLGRQSSGLKRVGEESLLANGFVTAALDSAIELLTLNQPPGDFKITSGRQIKTSRIEIPKAFDDLTEEFGYDLLDEEPTPVLRDKPKSTDRKSLERQQHPDPVQIFPSKKDGCRTVQEELEFIQKRRAFQLQRKDDSFDRTAPPGDCSDTTSPPGESYHTTAATTTFALPRDSVIARYRRRRAARRGCKTSSSSSSRDTVTSSSSSSRDLSTDSSSETRQSPPLTARRALRRRKRLRDTA